MPDHPVSADGAVPAPDRQADVLAIRDLAIAYAFAVDDRDWTRWKSLFTSDAHIDYSRSGGITGPLEQVAAWLPDAMSVFAWSLHSILTHEIRFTGAGTATGRVHLINRNGVEWQGTPELCDIGGMYLDEYRRVGDHWRIARRAESIRYVTGGAFASLVRDLAAKASPDQPRPYG
jgi:SnoaL-like domain